MHTVQFLADIEFTYLYTQILSDNTLLTIDNDLVQIDK